MLMDGALPVAFMTKISQDTGGKETVVNFATEPKLEAQVNMKKVAILQSNYIPWKGYFDMIASVDEFILYDDAQYTRQNWRNRNKIKTSNGLKWLTVPVKAKGKSFQKIRETKIEANYWAKTHYKSIFFNYKKSKFFHEINSFIQPIYTTCEYDNLSELNRTFIEAICRYLGIETKISNSWDYVLTEGKTERLVDLVSQSGGTEYISGPAAKDYIDESLFVDAGIKLTWFNYANYPKYTQLWGDFEHGVSILDLLFNCGKSSPQYMKY